jgi:hypothetical protein
MASLTKENDRGYVCWRLRFFHLGNRRSLRLGNVSKRSAEEVARHVHELIRACETGVAPAIDTVKWTMIVDRKIQEKLVEWGLCEPVSARAQTDAGRLLAAYLDNDIAERTTKWRVASKAAVPIFEVAEFSSRRDDGKSHEPTRGLP